MGVAASWSLVTIQAAIASGRAPFLMLSSMRRESARISGSACVHAFKRMVACSMLRCPERMTCSTDTRVGTWPTTSRLCSAAVAMIAS